MGSLGGERPRRKQLQRRSPRSKAGRCSRGWGEQVQGLGQGGMKGQAAGCAHGNCEQGYLRWGSSGQGVHGLGQQQVTWGVSATNPGAGQSPVSAYFTLSPRGWQPLSRYLGPARNLGAALLKQLEFGFLWPRNMTFCLYIISLCYLVQNLYLGSHFFVILATQLAAKANPRPSVPFLLQSLSRSQDILP